MLVKNSNVAATSRSHLSIYLLPSSKLTAFKIKDAWSYKNYDIWFLITRTTFLMITQAK